MNACRMEKGYRHWGHDIGIEDTPLEAGLAFTCAFDKPGGFIGRDAVLRQKDLGVPHKRLLQFRWPTRTNCCTTRSRSSPTGSRGRDHLGHGRAPRRASLGMGYVRRPHAVTPTGSRHALRGRRGQPARAGVAQLGAWYDARNERVKA
jgi:glycine cleavage system aminomethyltransferase T